MRRSGWRRELTGWGRKMEEWLNCSSYPAHYLHASLLMHSCGMNILGYSVLYNGSDQLA